MLCMCVHAADPVIMVFVPGVGCGILCLCSVMWELFKEMYLNIVIVMCFVASVMLSLFINDFICA